MYNFAKKNFGPYIFAEKEKNSLLLACSSLSFWPSREREYSKQAQYVARWASCCEAHEFWTHKNSLSSQTLTWLTTVVNLWLYTKKRLWIVWYILFSFFCPRNVVQGLSHAFTCILCKLSNVLSEQRFPEGHTNLDRVTCTVDLAVVCTRTVNKNPRACAPPHAYTLATLRLPYSLCASATASHPTNLLFFSIGQRRTKIKPHQGLFGNHWNDREWRALGWRNFHYKSKFSKIPFNPLISTWILHFPNKP
jgi:hypothetical protein